MQCGRLNKGLAHYNGDNLALGVLCACLFASVCMCVYVRAFACVLAYA